MIELAVAPDAADMPGSAPAPAAAFDGQHLHLHVMPGRPADERLELRECWVGDHRVEARYACHDPSLLHAESAHVLFLAVLAHYEHILHAWACEGLARDGAPVAPERVKVWPSIVDVAMPRTLSPRSELLQEVTIDEVCAIDGQRFLVKSRSHVNHCLTIEGRTPIHVL